MPLELARTVIEGAAAVALVTTLALILNQIRLQRRDLEHKIYLQIADRYSALLWLAAEDSRLDNVWRSLNPEEQAWLLERQTSDDRWSAWAALDSGGPDMPFDAVQEKRMYRYTRACLELCEQAFLAFTTGSVSARIWKKYEAVLTVWVGSRWFTYVFKENRSRLDDAFCREVDRIVQTTA